MKLTAWERFPYSVRKAWRVMRITTLLILVFCLHLSAKTTAQKITLSSTNISIEQFFNQLEKQTGYSFLLENGMVSKDEKISVNVKDVQLESVLDQILRPINLSYKIENKTVYILKKARSQQLGDGLSFPPPIDIHGHVTDSLGKPLAGASVTVKGSKGGTQTDLLGNFTLRNVDNNTILIISYTGYLTKQYIVNSDAAITVFLNKSNSLLDQVQVIAYGTTTQRYATGDVSSVKAADIEKQPVDNVMLALEGRVPGLFIQQATGLAGTNIIVRIQGQNSISQGNDPLYVIDGVPYSSELSSPVNNILAGASQGFGGSPLNFIDPQDIESVDVLKDADATSIYGSRAANGAILITTKKGKSGPTKVDINVQSGAGKVGHFLPLLSTPQYLQLRHEGFSNDGSVPGPNDYDLNGTWDSTRYTDWQKTLMGGTAQYTNAQASVSGGSANTNFLVGGGYYKQTTVFPGDLSDQKGSLHFNINHVSLNEKFHFQVTGNYMTDNNVLPGGDPTYTNISIVPDAPKLYNTDGSLNWAPLPNGSSTWSNPLSKLNNQYSNITDNLIGNLVMSYEILKGLQLKASLGYNNLTSNQVNVFPLSAYAPDVRQYVSRFSYFGNGSVSSYNIEPQIVYNRELGKGSFEALVGTTILESKTNQEQFFGSGFTSDQLMKDIGSASTVFVMGTVDAVYRYNAVFGRLNYNLQNKYVVNVTARRDGSSRFGPDEQFHNFGSAAGAWLFYNENFIKELLPGISFGKLRVSYGTTGNDQIGDYQFMSLYNPYSVPSPYQGAVGFQPTRISNPYLQWEETRKLEFGLDLGFLKDHILFNTVYYHNRSSNQLTPYTLPEITGFTSVQTNLPAVVQNTGWEFSLNTINIKKQNFSWTTSINLTIPANKLVSFPNLASSSVSNLYAVGSPITLEKIYHYFNVDPATGIYQFTGADGKPTSNPHYPLDLTALINTGPRFYGGIQNNIRYGGFEFDFLFQFVKQTAAGNYLLGNRPGYFYSDGFTSSYGNQPVWVLNHWSKPGDISNQQQVSASYPSNIYSPYSAATYSNLIATDASFIRLKNVSLYWSLPNSWIQGAHLQSGKLYIQAQNLLTITSYKGLDPENQSAYVLPPLRVITFGVQIAL